MKLPFFDKKKDNEEDDIAAYLRSIIRNAVRMDRTEANTEPPLGTSKLGGKPHLPAGFVWPRYEGESYDGEVAERPLSFIAQLDLSAVAVHDKDRLLPATGYLYFFYDIITQPWGFDPADEGCARVYYFDVSADALTVTDLPDDLAAEARVPLQAVTLAPMDELPSYEELDDLTDTARFGDDLDWDSYDETVAETIDLLDCDPEEVCKLLGYADLIQGSIIHECAMIHAGRNCGNAKAYRDMTDREKAAVKADAKNWTLLAQFGTLADEIMFGDCGCIYFYIRKEDLAARRFDRVWLSLQCG